MAQDKQPTRIVLRRWKDDRQVIAIMPDIVADYHQIGDWNQIAHCKRTKQKAVQA